jgi:preprotein translocase subunit YajC
VTHFLLELAQAAPTGGPGGLLSSPLPMFIIMGGILYFLVLRPQSKKAKAHQQMLSDLKKGDDVTTQGGLIGRITGIKDDEVTLQVQEGVRLRILRSAITGPRKPAEKPAEASKGDVKAS